MARKIKNKELLNTRLATNGKIFIDFEDSKIGKESNDELVTIKNRLCCPKENDPLITILDKKVESYEMKITCKSCQNIYKKTK